MPAVRRVRDVDMVIRGSPSEHAACEYCLDVVVAARREGREGGLYVGARRCSRGRRVGWIPSTLTTVSITDPTLVRLRHPMSRDPHRDTSGKLGNTYIRLQLLTNAIHPPLTLALSFPPTSTRHPHSLPSSFSASSHMKCPKRFFAPIVKCTVCSPMTYSYTIVRISNGNMAKKLLWHCACVRASTSAFGTEVKLIVDFLARIDPCGLSLTSSFAFDFAFALLIEKRRWYGFLVAEPSCDGMSEGIQRMAGSGNNPKSLSFMA